MALSRSRSCRITRLPDVPGRTAADLRLGPDADTALTARNLAGSGHGEFGPVAMRAAVDRNLLPQARWHWF